MKKRNVINLIKYHAEDNDIAFRNEAMQIAKEFDDDGDYQLSEYIASLLSSSNTFVPQMTEADTVFLQKIETSSETLVLPESIASDILGIVNAVNCNLDINKFLFQGAPGTGKTESVKHLARLLDRRLYMVDFASIVDSRLGQTQKNINDLFNELNLFANPENIIVLFDEIDALAMDRTNENDLREMGRATSAILKGFDGLDSRIVLVATTNLFSKFDKALIRRFDMIINFDRYQISDLKEVAEKLFVKYIKKVDNIKGDIPLLKKIVGRMDPVLSPGELKNVIKTSIAFSDRTSGYEYLQRLYKTICADATSDIKILQEQGFTTREIEKLTGVSRSQVSRISKGEKNE